MDGFDAGVMDAPEVMDDQAGELEQDLDVSADTAEDAAPDQAEAAQGKDDPYTTRFSREFRAATKAWETANPDMAKYAKQARDNHARLFALQQLEPTGIDGVREKYALLDSLAVGDAKGLEAVTAMQERLQATDEVDSLIAAGDPKAFDALGVEFNAGLAKLAPAYLDRVRAADPQAYSAAVLPHFVEALKTSELVQSFNDLVDILNTTDDPRLDDQAKMKLTLQKLGRMGEWLNAQQEKAGSLKTLPANMEQDKLHLERTQFEQEKQQTHWDTNIKPVVTQHENSKFEELFKPYNLRLKLDAAAKADLQQSFRAALTKAGNSDAKYLQQMTIYRAQKNPDPAAVANYVKNAINKHSKPVMESLVKARYSSFLNGKPRAQAQAGAKPQPPAGPNVEIRTVKPPMSEIDHQNTPIDWLAQKKYRLYSGKVIQVRN